MHSPESAMSVPLQNVMNVLNTHLQWKAINGPHRSNLHYHPSSFGKCLRKAQYELFEERGWIKGEKEKKANEILRIFDTGHAMHHRWARYFEEIGVLRGRWHCSNPACFLWDDTGVFAPDKVETNGGKNIEQIVKEHHSRHYGYDNKIGCFKPKECACGSTHFHYHELSATSEELNFGGHVDQVLDFSQFDASIYKTGNKVSVLYRLDELPKTPVVVDMKTINSRDFQDKIMMKPHFEYKVQLTIYINVLGLESGLLLYENKDNSRVRAFEIRKNPDLWEKIKEQATLMKSMIEEKKLPPPRPASKTSGECRFCPFRSKCHGEDGKPSIWDRLDLDDLRKKFYGGFE